MIVDCNKIEEKAQELSDLHNFFCAILAKLTPSNLDEHRKDLETYKTRIYRELYSIEDMMFEVKAEFFRIVKNFPKFIGMPDKEVLRYMNIDKNSGRIVINGDLRGDISTELVIGDLIINGNLFFPVSFRDPSFGRGVEINGNLEILNVLRDLPDDIIVNGDVKVRDNLYEKAKELKRKGQIKGRLIIIDPDGNEIKPISK